MVPSRDGALGLVGARYGGVVTKSASYFDMCCMTLNRMEMTSIIPIPMTH